MVIENKDEEQFVIVDINDDPLHYVTGKKALHDYKEGEYHRGVHVFIELPRGRFMIQLKGEGTENAGKWSSSVSGHVRAGEDYKAAAVREIMEEVGLHIDPAELEQLGVMHPCAETGNEFAALFTYLMADTEYPRPDMEEVKELAVVRMSDLVRDLKANKEKYSPAFLIMFKLFEDVYISKGE